MKKVLPNHLLHKLGLVISTCYALTKFLEAKESPVPEESRLAALWSIESKAHSAEIADDPNQPFYHSINDSDIVLPPSNSSKNPDSTNQHLLFPVDRSIEPLNSPLFDSEEYEDLKKGNESKEDYPTDSTGSRSSQIPSVTPDQPWNAYPPHMPEGLPSSPSRLPRPTIDIPEENPPPSAAKISIPKVALPPKIPSPTSANERMKAHPLEEIAASASDLLATPDDQDFSKPLLESTDDVGIPDAYFDWIQEAYPDHLDIPPSYTETSIDKNLERFNALLAQEEPAPTAPTPAAPTDQNATPAAAQPPTQPAEPEDQNLLPQTQLPNQQEAQPQPPPSQPKENEAAAEPLKSILINFNNVGIIEYIRFISRISNKNFVFDESDLQFNVTIVSEEPTSIENIMAALIQELRIHDLTLIEQGNNLIIHKNPKVNSVSKVLADDIANERPIDAEIVTQVFRLNTLDPSRAASIIRPLVSEKALVEYISETNHLIVTDILTNVQQIGKLLKSIDSPVSGLVIGQYLAKMTDIETLLPLVQRIMAPISQDQPLSFIPYEQANSIFIVSTPFLVERSISILQHLDQEKGKTRIIDLSQLKFEQPKPGVPKKPITPYPIPPEGYPQREGGPGAVRATGWDFGPGNTEAWQNLGSDEWLKDRGLLPTLGALTPEQQAALNACKNLPKPTQVGVTDFREEAPIQPERFGPKVSTGEGFVPFPTNRSKFYIHKLQYRAGDAILDEIKRVADSLRNTRGNEELLNTIASAQWLMDSKAIVFTGTPEFLEKVKDLIEQIDLPLREVFIEMLILDTTVDDSLNYSVNWGSRFGGGNQAGSQGFLTGASPLQGTLDTTGVTDLGLARPNPPTTVPFNNALIPDPTNLAKNQGFNLGVIGQNIIHKGLGIQFNSIGALVKALHTRDEARIVMSPKIISEDNVPAYIFVGINTPFQTQSVSNDRGSIITNNFEFRDVGTSLQVTPHLGNSDVVTLEIIQEVSSLSNVTTQNQNSNAQIGPTTRKNTTKTTVHLPDGYFVIISGMMQDENDRNRIQIPCLGSVPLVGGAFSDLGTVRNKRNLMIFIRAQIIDTDEQIQNITRHQQDIWKFKEYEKKMWVEEAQDGLDFLNVRKTQNTDSDPEDVPQCDRFVH